MLAASSVENALSVSVCTLPRLPVTYNTDAIASSFGVQLSLQNHVFPFSFSISPPKES
jgi:hypothetical protein